MKKIIFLFLVLGILIPSTLGFAKGEFDYIVIKGPGITGDISVTNPDLTQDFSSLQIFHRRNSASLRPRAGYQIVRMIVKGSSSDPFDQLHYYPYTGYAYYDGLVNGSSEYDGSGMRLILRLKRLSGSPGGAERLYLILLQRWW